VGYRSMVVLDPGLRRDDDSIRLNFVPFVSDSKDLFIKIGKGLPG